MENQTFPDIRAHMPYPDIKYLEHVPPFSLMTPLVLGIIVHILQGE